MFILTFKIGVEIDSKNIHKYHLRIQKWYKNQIFLLMIFKMYIWNLKKFKSDDNLDQNKNRFIIFIIKKLI